MVKYNPVLRALKDLRRSLDLKTSTGEKLLLATKEDNEREFSTIDALIDVYLGCKGIKLGQLTPYQKAAVIQGAEFLSGVTFKDLVDENHIQRLKIAVLEKELAELKGTKLETRDF
jgi:hypothetical protein